MGKMSGRGDDLDRKFSSRTIFGAQALTPLLPTPAYQWAAAALGVLAGTGLNVMLSGHSAEDSTRSVLTAKL